MVLGYNIISEPNLGNDLAMPEDDFVADIVITIAPNPCVGLACFAVHALDVAHSFALQG
ncbi:hypothetical protein RVBP17_0180 [Pseudomonas phage sp. 30-3]|nr:hypothetical protein RVBP17_0180 [Pseudomonas phage sp. 30-3]